MRPSSDRPIPVRELVGSTDPPPADSASAPPAVEPPPPEARTFEGEGEVWEVEVVSRTRSGQSSDAGALLLELQFTREGGHRRAWAAGRTLEDLPDEALEAVLSRARPFHPEDVARVQETRGGVSG